MFYAVSPKELAKAWPPKKAAANGLVPDVSKAGTRTDLWQSQHAVQSQAPRWTSKTLEERDTFPGVMALSKRFEMGQLSEGNVARLAQAFTPSMDSR